jgi:hypothetical protein
MKSKTYMVLVAFALIAFSGCKKESTSSGVVSIKDVGIKVSFSGLKSADILKATIALTKETPTNYFVGLKSATLIGSSGTANAVLFSKSTLSTSLVFDFTNDNTIHSLLKGSAIPDGKYSGIEIEVYFLQMNIAISTGTRGKERRNFRIYLSDDAETEGGVHQPGDMTQINNSQVEIGWLLGEGVMPNMDPVSPRVAAYTFNSNGSNWYDFAGKSGKDFGPFGDVKFMTTAPHPIYKVKTDFSLGENKGSNLVLDLNVNSCWQFEDKNGDGAFGPGDLDPINPTAWQMVLPTLSVVQN